MNLVIDQGNSVCKVAFFEQGSMVKAYVLPHFRAYSAKRILERHPQIEQCVYCSVAGDDEELLVEIRKKASVMIVNGATPAPIEVRYDRNKLGGDRLAAAVGAHFLAPKNTEILVIDSGTAVTYERIDAKGVYLGGNISPGLQVRYRALHEFTGKLPWMRRPMHGDWTGFYGQNTEDAIKAGVLRGMLYEMDGYIDELKKMYPFLWTFLAGGDSFYFESRLKNKTFALRDLVVIGLNRLLEFNKQ